ncbi:MAG: hypothetical protein FJW23_12030 [Acidimicrobiia bacterium]|nr:hypothetical protein [Acidimicrobiia bacterium]
MSVRRETLQIARLAPKLLGDSADLVVSYIRGLLTPEGGFANRGRDTDLYYTLFGLQALVALRADVPAAEAARYLRTFGGGDDLDLVHLACLAGSWATLRDSGPDAAERDRMLGRVERHRAADGGYHAAIGSPHGSAYHAFLALGAWQDLGRVPPEPERLIETIPALRADDGGFANGPGQRVGSTTATAAAVTLMRHLEMPIPAGLDAWLLARCHEGGFFASPDAPIPDLLSTATALHALASLRAPFDAIREPCLDFVDSLWTSQGGFHGTWLDDAPDCEYTFYGLLALGHLAV